METEANSLPPHDPALMTFEILVCTIGVTGNALVIFVVLILREYKKAVTHWYVLQLAIADCVFLLTIPFKVIEDWNNEWIFSAGFCKVKESVLYLNYYSSVLFLMVMSLDRYIAICHEYSKLQKLRSHCACYVITASVWLISLLLSLPIWLYSDKNGFEPHCTCGYLFPADDTFEEECAIIYEGQCLQDCIESKRNAPSCLDPKYDEESMHHCHDYSFGDHEDYEYYGNYSYDYSGESDTGEHLDGYNMTCTFENHPKSFKAFITYNFVALFLIPFIVMSVCYTLIIFRLRKSRLRSGSLACSGEYPTRRKSVSKTEKKLIRVTVLCGILVVLFVVCWLPFHFTLALRIRGISGTNEFCIHLSSVLSCLAYTNSALNPYVYNFIEAKFSRRLRRASTSLGTSFRERFTSISKSGREDRIGSVASVTGKIDKKSETRMTGDSTRDSSQKGEKSEEGKPMMAVTYKSKGDEVEIAQD